MGEHVWFEIDEETRIARFCENCDICACHSGDLVNQPCPGADPAPNPKEQNHE